MIAFAGGRLVARCIFAGVLVAVCSSPLCGDDRFARSRSSSLLDDSSLASPVFISDQLDGEQPLELNEDDYLAPEFSSDMDCGDGVSCGDSITDCGDSVSCGDGVDGKGKGKGKGKNGEPLSLLDPFLPRSNLPLPLMSGFAEEREIVLPLPLGTSFVWTEMNRNVAISDVRLAFGDNTPTSAERVSVPTTKFHASAKVARVDLWVLPCFNLYGLVGHTRSTGDVDVTISRFPLPISPPITLDIPVVLEGPTAGWGCTSGIGSADWFAMLDINKTWTNFEQFESSMTCLVITPRVGRVIDLPWFKGEIHTGAMWQDTRQTVELVIDHPILGPGLHVEVDQYEPRPWNFLIGGLWAIDERLQLLVEGGTGGRSYVLTGATIRY